jgi:hypothetical protein
MPPGTMIPELDYPDFATAAARWTFSESVADVHPRDWGVDLIAE